MAKLKNVRLVHLEHFVQEPQAVLDSICADLKLPKMSLPAGVVKPNVNAKYMKEWRRESDEVALALIQSTRSCLGAESRL